MQKYGTMDPALWEQFQEYCVSRGLKLTSFADRVVRDAIAGRYVHLQQLSASSLLELEQVASESGATVELLASSIISKWCAQHLAERKKRK